MRSDSVFSANSLQAYLSLILLCGAALALSIAPPSRIAALRTASLSYPPGLFHLAFIVILGMFSVNRGAVIAAHAVTRTPRPRTLLRMIEHIAYGLMLMLPYLVYSRALLPTRTPGILLLLAYGFISSIFICAASFRMEHQEDWRRRGAFLLRYGAFTGFCVIPLGLGLAHPSLKWLMSVSPVGFTSQIVSGVSGLQVLVGFLTPVVGAAWLITRRQRIQRRPNDV